MQQWTEAQKKAIASDAERLICSAAAGSGKTAVMIERIVRMIREGADPFSFLVITFTNAAAAEMKEKIRKRLLEERHNPVIAAAAEKSAAMEVCTIHAFCQHLIRQEFQIVGVDPFFRICTGAQKEKLFTDAFRQACNVLQNRKDSDYLSFIRQYEPGPACEMVSAVWSFIMSMPEPFDWLEEKTENLPLNLEQDHPWFETVSEMIGEKILSLRVILRRQADMFEENTRLESFRSVYREDQERVEALCGWAEKKTENREKLLTDFGRLPALRNATDWETDWRDRYRNLREQMKKIFTEIVSWICLDRDQTKKEFIEVRNALRGLRKITEETHTAYEQNKRRICALDFTDLEHKALEILKNGNGRAAVQTRYRYIFVDECQDVSSVQDELIGNLAGDNNSLFMVGDVKQSIYRFRLANPKLFQARIDRCGPGRDTSVYLQENFRSRPEILETANIVFRDVMRKKAAGLEYGPKDELRPGLAAEKNHVPVSVDLLEIGEQNRLEAVAAHTAERIRELKERKEADFRDIVILLPEVSTDGPVLTELLKNQGIPVFFDGKGGFFEQPEVDLFRNLLMLLNDPHLDLPLLTVLVNPPFDFTEEELSHIRLMRPGKETPFWQAFEAAAEGGDSQGRKCCAVREKMNGWRFLSSRMRLPDFLWYLLEDSSLCAVFGAADHGHAAQKNLRSFCLQASAAAERGVCSLREFLDYLTEQASGGELQAASTLMNDDNLVRIMTMHKSKGLQFPVVFCLGLDKSLKAKTGGAVQLDETLGLCLGYRVPKWRLARKTAADAVFEWKRHHDVKAEKICLLYVAVTRAQKKLFLVGTETDRALWHMPEGDHRTLAAADYLDLIMPALYDEEKKSTTDTQATNPWEIRVYSNIQQENVENKKVFHNLRPWVETLLSAAPVDDLWNTDPTEKMPEETENVLKKYSVTAVLQSARKRIFLDDEQTPEEKRTPDYVKSAMKRYQAARRPAFLEPAKEADGAARGTAVHRFLSLVDLETLRQAGGAETEILGLLLDRLVETKVFTDREASWISLESAAGFFSSEIGRRMLASPEVHREWEFNLRLRERGMMVQGMIDCAFREGDGWILLDYKTDRIDSIQAFTEEYRPQLEWYALALRELTGMRVKEKWLYALSVDKAIAVSNNT